MSIIVLLALNKFNYIYIYMSPNTIEALDWYFIYLISNDYPNSPNYQQVQNFKEFFESIQYVLICPKFKKYYNEYITQHPIVLNLDNRKTLKDWVLHMEHPTLQNNNNLPFIWVYLHNICQGYPIEPDFQTILFYKNFFLSLTNVLPNCYRLHYNQHIRQIPINPYLSSRKHLCQWNNLLTINDNIIEPFVNNSSIPIMLIITSLAISVILYYKILVK